MESTQEMLTLGGRRSSNRIWNKQWFLQWYMVCTSGEVLGGAIHLGVQIVFKMMGWREIIQGEKVDEKEDKVSSAALQHSKVQHFGTGIFSSFFLFIHFRIYFYNILRIPHKYHSRGIRALYLNPDRLLHSLSFLSLLVEREKISYINFLWFMSFSSRSPLSG